MGACSCIPHRREFYTDVDSEEEASIRRWEENLGAFSKTFNEVSRKICFEKNESDPAYVESLFREVFGEQILTLLRKDFFKHKNKNGISEEYNSKKLERFIFLISRPEKLKSIK